MTRITALKALLFGIVLAGMVIAPMTHADVLPYGLKIEKVLDGAASLGDLAQSPGGELWLLERSTGTIRVFDAGQEVASLTLAVDATCNSGLLDVAFDPEYSRNRRALVYRVDPTSRARVDEVFFGGDDLSLGANVLDIGTLPLGCNPGGGMAVGDDGKLYIGVGDLDDGANGQNAASLAGKILRMELDGSIPPDNASGTLVWASGFRNGVDLAIHPDTGGLYMVDLGASGLKEEVNRVFEGGNYGWDTVSGDSGGTFDDPIVSYNNTIGTRGLTVLGDSLGDSLQNTVLFASDLANLLGSVQVTGPNLDQPVPGTEGFFYRPNSDRDGTPDPGCPGGLNALELADDGAVYTGAAGANPGVWRLWRDTPGPREVSAPGSPFHLTVDRSGADLTIGWENLGSVDAGRPPRNAGQHAEAYQIWEGTLPIGGAYDHASLATADGTPNGPARLEADVSPGSGDRYYLVTAQGDNLEGSAGSATDGTPRLATIDYCATIGYGTTVGKCAEPWVNESTGGELRLRDENPASPTYNQFITMSDFRGRVVKMDISALNCVFCNLQAPYHNELDTTYRDRDLVIITVMTDNFNFLNPIAPALCKDEVAAWAATHDELNPIVCDVDLDNDGEGDVTRQYWNQAGCGGTPQNFYFDQGHVLKDFVCGGELSFAQQASHVTTEVNPETCE